MQSILRTSSTPLRRILTGISSFKNGVVYNVTGEVTAVFIDPSVPLG
jgi:hypothetical protein